MALSSILPKSWLDKLKDPKPSPGEIIPAAPIPVDHEPPVFVAEEERLPGRDANGKRKLPPVALYVSGAAFAMTIGLTALVVPYMRQMNKIKVVPTFNGHRYVRSIPKATTSQQADAVAGQTAVLDVPTTASEARKPERVVDPVLQRSRFFNAKEEKKLYGSPIPQEGGVVQDGSAGPLLGVYALGIATAVVGASAGLGMWIVARLMGVSSMEEFAQKARQSLKDSMPGLAQSMEGARTSDRALLGAAADEPELDEKGLAALFSHWVSDPPSEDKEV